MSKISFDLDADAAHTLCVLIGAAQLGSQYKDPGIPFAVYELRTTLDDERQSPDEELRHGSPEHIGYCKEHDLSLQYFPKQVTWEFRRHLLLTLKLVLIDAMKVQTGSSVGVFIDLCKMLRLTAWFNKTFKRTVTMELEDDCDLDDEIEDEKPEAAAAD